MYDLASKFNAFYNSYVVLSREDQVDLRHKKDLNIQRLTDGLLEYNDEFNTSYSIVETCEQGSVAMSTVVQNESKDYDIDVAVVFDKTVLGDKGPLATRKIVANALGRKTKQFNAEPEVKTSCVRVKYEDGYHIDFAIFRRSQIDGKWKYEHAGVEWSERELNGLTEWFKEKNEASDGCLRKVVRLSKMFCKSRDSWVNMPSGLLQTVLCDEKLQEYDRIDELFYYTMKEIVNRLESDITVSAPVDNNRDLTPRQSDRRRMTNWKNRLKSKLEDLDILFEDECTQEDALQAWYGFFNHDYWSDQVAEAESYALSTIQSFAIRAFNDNEEFIEDKYQMNLIYECKVACSISGDGFRQKPISEFLGILRHFVPHNFQVKCTMVNTSCPEPYKVLWKVKNVGPEAERRNMMRGRIRERGNTIVEPTSFYGNHYIECYIIKNNTCVARKKINVPIGRR